MYYCPEAKRLYDAGNKYHQLQSVRSWCVVLSSLGNNKKAETMTITKEGNNKVSNKY
jgi:hypothetical protein